MHYLILADVHANLDALAVVLKYAEKEGIDKYIILGDTVDYGALPNETLDVLRNLHPQEAVRGDHEKWYTGELTDEYFVEEALFCARWTKGRLTPENLEYIKSLPAGPRVIDDKFAIVHGSYVGEDDYILDGDAAHVNLERLKVPIGFYAHTHVPLVISKGGDGRLEVIRFEGEKNDYKLDPDKIYLINPGSVGQPRDFNPLTSFAIFLSDELLIRMVRLPYDNGAAARKIIDAGLPAFLAQRLIVGC